MDPHKHLVWLQSVEMKAFVYFYRQMKVDDDDKLTSPVAATWPVMPIFMGKRDSKGLVRGASSSSLRSSLASKSNTREKLPLDASCTSSICGENRAHHQHKIVIRVIRRRCKCHCLSLTCTLWH